MDRPSALRRTARFLAGALIVFGVACGDDPAPPPEGPAPGRWYKVRTHRFDDELSADQREEVARLESVGYVSGSMDAPDLSGVTVHDAARAQPGYSFFTSGHAQEAVLADMTGRVLHRWSHDFWKIWPEYPIESDHKQTIYWRRAHLFENGDLLAIYEGLGLIKLDRDSNLLWASPVRAHHDLQVMPNGEIYVLTREAHVVPRVHSKKPILEDFVSVLDAEGNEKRRVSILEALESSEFDHLWDREKRRVGDIFHTNTLEVLDGRLGDRISAFASGNVLVSMLHLDAIAVIDLDAGSVVWAWSADFDSQHDPKVLNSGNLLLFDNRGPVEHSRVVEFDPVSGEVAWDYSGTAEQPFYSKWCGTAQRLPNGNTLITESDNGRAIEVTPGHEIVWEFYNPHRAGDHGEFIATLFEMLRLGEDFPVEWTTSGDATGHEDRSND